jgi:phenylacetate-coenzyme A ligase PaaK-like adenylate-forming protein
VNNYLGRHWWGLQPFDPQVRIWGHYHLFGSGLRGRLTERKRRVADRLLNITGLNAYDLSEQSLASHYAALRRHNPVALVGYTSAIFKLARYVERNRLDLGDKTRLRAVIMCAETVSDADVATVEQVFGASAVIEYGAAETGVIAMSRQTATSLQIIWDSFICLAAADGSLNVTTLDQRLFPLVNWAIGDVVEASDIEDGNALWLRAVLGRRQNMVQVATSSGILDLSALLPIAILKSYPGVVGVQFKQERSDALRIYVQADRTLDLGDVTAHFVRDLRREHPGFDPTSVTFAQVAEQAKTLAGKHALFVS